MLESLKWWLQKNNYNLGCILGSEKLDVYKNIKFSFKWCGMSIKCLEAIKILILACDFSVSTMQKWNAE